MGLIGYIEKDNQPGITDNEEKIYIGSTVEAGVVVMVGCSNW